MRQKSISNWLITYADKKKIKMCRPNLKQIKCVDIRQIADDFIFADIIVELANKLSLVLLKWIFRQRNGETETNIRSAMWACVSCYVDHYYLFSWTKVKTKGLNTHIGW